MWVWRRWILPKDITLGWMYTVFVFIFSGSAGKNRVRTTLVGQLQNLNWLQSFCPLSQRWEAQATGFLLLLLLPYPFTSTLFVLYLLTVLCNSSHTEAGIPPLFFFSFFLNRCWDAGLLAYQEMSTNTFHVVGYLIIWSSIASYLDTCRHIRWIQGLSVWLQWRGLSFSWNLLSHNEVCPRSLTLRWLWWTRGPFFCCQHWMGLIKVILNCHGPDGIWEPSSIGQKDKKKQKPENPAVFSSADLHWKAGKKNKKSNLLHWFVYFKGFAYRCTFLKAVTSKYNNISHSCTSCTSHWE